jgi:hypothetical protein
MMKLQCILHANNSSSRSYSTRQLSPCLVPCWLMQDAEYEASLAADASQQQAVKEEEQKRVAAACRWDGGWGWGSYLIWNLDAFFVVSGITFLLLAKAWTLNKQTPAWTDET